MTDGPERIPLLNGREPKDWQLPAVRRGLAQEMDRDKSVLAGLIAEDPPPERTPRPVTDLSVDFTSADFTSARRPG